VQFVIFVQVVQFAEHKGTPPKTHVFEDGIKSLLEAQDKHALGPVPEHVKQLVSQQYPPLGTLEGALHVKH
jgi:hypothetical protein